MQDDRDKRHKECLERVLMQLKSAIMVLVLFAVGGTVYLLLGPPVRRQENRIECDCKEVPQR